MRRLHLHRRRRRPWAARRGARAFLLLGHTTDPTGVKAPRRVGFRMFRTYAPGHAVRAGRAARPSTSSATTTMVRRRVGIDPVTGLINEERPDAVDEDRLPLDLLGRPVPRVAATARRSTVQVALAVQALRLHAPARRRARSRAVPTPSATPRSCANAIEAQKTFRGGTAAGRRSGEPTPDARGRETGLIAPAGHDARRCADCRDEEGGQRARSTTTAATWFDFDCNFCTGVPGTLQRRWLAAAPPPNPDAAPHARATARSRSSGTT